jgi:hypothetical protein
MTTESFTPPPSTDRRSGDGSRAGHLGLPPAVVAHPGLVAERPAERAARDSSQKSIASIIEQFA